MGEAATKGSAEVHSRTSRPLGPTELAAAGAAYDMALCEIADRGGIYSSLDAGQLKLKLASAVIAEASKGHVDERQLTAAVLASLEAGPLHGDFAFSNPQPSRPEA